MIILVERKFNMKKYIFTLSLAISSLWQSQSYSVPREPGTLVDFKPFIEKQQIKGYAQLIKGQGDDANQTYHYTLLDADFNKIYQGSFTENRKTAQPNLKYAFYKDGKLFLDINELAAGIYMNDRFLFVDTQTGASTPVLTMKDGQAVEVKSEAFTPLNYSFTVYPVEGRGFIMSESQKKGLIGYYKNLILFDQSGKKIWQNTALPVDSDSHFYEYSVMAADRDIVAALVSYYKNRNNLSDQLLLLDAATGKQIALKPLSQGKYNLQFNEVKMDDNFLYLVGTYYSKTDDAKRLEYKLESKLGLYRYKINKKTGDLVSEVYLPFTDLGKYVDISPDGKIKKEGILFLRSIEIRPDGRNVIIAETYKPETFVSGGGFTELYTMLLSPDFKIEEMKSFNMDFTVGSKFAYTQILPGNTGLSSIFRNQEGKEFTINEIVYTDANSNFETKKLVIKKEDKDKYLVPAKPGYIGVRDDYYFKAKKLGKSADISLMKIGDQ